MKRVLVGGFHHESNSLSDIISGEKEFRVLKGSEITERVVPNSSLSGIVETLKKNGVEVVPTLHMRGVPNGEISQQFFETVKNEFLDMARKERGAIDAITLALHGSMRIQNLGEAEGIILEELRSIFPNTPIFVALDMHTSMSETMCRYADGMVGYKTAPHIDCTETGVQAANMTLFRLNTGILPKSCTVRIPMIVAGEKSGTDVEPMLSLIEELRRVEQDEEVLAASYLLGFPWADNPDNAVSVHVVTKHSAEAAERLALELAQKFWDRRDDFVFVTEAYEIDAALNRAFSYIASGDTPVYLSDSGDNPTAGGTGDNTDLLNILIRDDRIRTFIRPDSKCGRTAENAAGTSPLKSPLKAPVIYAGFYDPDSVKQCKENVGKHLTLNIGGTFDRSFESVTIRGFVKQYIEDYVYVGIPGDIAVFSTGGIDLILTENHIGFTDPGMMTTLGLDPQHADIVICKLGYLTPGHTAIAEKSILVLTRGATNQDIPSIGYRNIMRPVYPIDRDIDYKPSEYRIVSP